jgi:hypothetical protein
MKLRSTAVVLAALAVLAVVPNAAAQGATGTWVGETSGAGGLARRAITLVLAADGTGTMEVDVVQEVLDLKIDGSRLSFAFRPQILGQPANFLFRYQGEFDADAMRLYVAIDRGDGAEPTPSEEPLVLTRR